MEVDSGQTADTNSHSTMSSSQDAVEPNSSQTNTPDVPATSPISKSRYGRTRKPKITEDFYNIDVIFETARELKRSPRPLPQLKSPISKSMKPQQNQSPQSKPKVNSSVIVKSSKAVNSKSKHFVHVTGDTVIAECVTALPTSDTMSNEVPLPVNTKTVRKFFKRESIAPTNLKECNAVDNSVNVKSNKQSDCTEVEACLNSDIPALVDASLPAVDVTKVLKIISTKSSDLLQNNSDSKGGSKPVLKTYSNKRKNFQKAVLVESFGLPDKPIFPLENEKPGASNEPKRIKNLDVAAPSSESEINLVDKKLLDTPWKIASMNSDFADNEILLETSCDDSQDTRKDITSCLTNNSITAGEEFLLPENTEKINDDKIKSNKLLHSEAASNVETSENIGSENQAESSKTNKSPEKSQNIAKLISTKVVKEQNQAKELKMVKVRSPRKQKQTTSELLVTVTEDSKIVDIKTSARSPRKQKQTTCEPLVTVTEDLKTVEVKTAAKSPQKQKQTTCEPLVTVTEDLKTVEIKTAAKSPQKQKQTTCEPLVTVTEDSKTVDIKTSARSPRKQKQTTSELLVTVTEDSKIVDIKTSARSPKKQKQTTCEPMATVTEDSKTVEIKTATRSPRKQKQTTCEPLVTVTEDSKTVEIKTAARSPRKQMQTTCEPLVTVAEDLKSVEIKTATRSPKKQKQTTCEPLVTVTEDLKTVEIKTAARSPKKQKQTTCEPLVNVTEDLKSVEIKTAARSPKRQKHTTCEPLVTVTEDLKTVEIKTATRSPTKQMQTACEPLVTVTEELKTGGIKTAAARSPRKQKQTTCEPLVTVTEDLKSAEIKTLAARTLRNKSPRKPNQISDENDLTVPETSVKDSRKGEVAANESKTAKSKSPRKQKGEKLSEPLEIHGSIKNDKNKTAESPNIVLQPIDLPPPEMVHSRSSSQKRKLSLSPKKAVKNAEEQVASQAKENSATLTPQRKSLRIQTEAAENLPENSNAVLSAQLPKKIKNTDKVIKEFSEINIFETSPDKKSKIKRIWNFQKRPKTEEKNVAVNKELDEMSLKDRIEKSKVELVVELSHKLGRPRGRKSTIQSDEKLSSTIGNAIHEEVVENSKEKKARKEYDREKLDDSDDIDEMSLFERSKLIVSPSGSKRDVFGKRDFSAVTSGTTSELLLEVKEENVDEDNCDSVKESENKQEDIKNEDSGKSLYDLQIKVEPEDVELGDLMWAKIGGHPYWPCVVAEDPISKEYKLMRKYIKNYMMSYHVRFFGDRGRRSWVSSASVIRFTGKNDLKILYEKVKCKTSSAALLQPYIVKPIALSKWENAVFEAESVTSSTPQQRFDFFFNMFASDDEKKQKLLESVSSPIETEEANKIPKSEDISEMETEQDFLKSPPIKADMRKSGKAPKSNVSRKQLKVPIKTIKTPKSRKSEHIACNKPDIKSPLKKHIRSKSLPPSAFEPPSNKSDNSSESGRENDKLQPSENSEKSSQSSKSGLNENDSTSKPPRKGMSKSNSKQELDSNSRNSLPLQKEILKIKVRKESRESSIDEPPETFLKNPWQVFDMAKRQLNTPLNEVNSECSLSDTDSHSKSSTNTPIPSTYKDQIARQRRNNLFRGIPRHRVCQVCKKPGEILKCKGPCNGLFHYNCSAKTIRDASAVVIKEEVSTESESSSVKNEELKENDTNAESNLSNGIPDTNDTEKDEDNCTIEKVKNDSKLSEPTLSNAPLPNGDQKQKSDSLKLEGKNAKVALEDKAKVEKISNSSKAIADTSNASNKVEIIHIDCDDSDFEHSLTPKVRLTPSIDFSKLSLAEQIDMKMKEIMQKFEKNTRYADSTTDYTSSEESTSNIAPAIPKPKITQKKKTVKVKHVTADCTTDNSSSENLIGEGTSTDLSQEINSSSCSQGVSSTANSEIIESNAKNSEQCPMESEIAVNVQKNIEPAAEEFHVTGDTAIDCEPSSDLHSIKEFRCGYCIAEIEPPCFVCDKEVSSKNVSFRQKCSLHMCGKFYHPECLKMWPQTQWSLISTAKHKNSNKRLDTFVCPVHVCHTCASDNPHAAISRCTSDKVVKCLHCPATYHTTNYCVPAGTLILSTSQIVCPRHLGQKIIKKGKMVKYSRTINTPWCFICSKGGDLICCETCPTSVHSDCLQINLLEDGTFICEDCETGRFPLYDEIVWVKLGAYRWWPAVILFPNEIPDNIKNIPHSKGEFVVKFFGTHDHYWVHRGRVFLFQEGDRGHCSPTRKRVDALFKKSIEEAAAAHHFKKVFKMNKEAEIRTGMKPPPYIRVKVNKPVGNVRLFDGNISNTTSCECDANQAHPCGPDSDCLNRLLLTECDPNICPAKDRCNNQQFEKRQYPPLVPFKTPARGWGLKTLTLIRKGDFVIEYVGEIIDEQEYQRRIHKMHEQKDENYYFLTIDKDRIIDAGPKGNLARFMNHCCQPNCETQKWTVNGDTRVGLFAVEDIPGDAELTFNYNLECIGKEKKICKCGAPNCSGFIGVKAKVDESQKKPKKNNNIKKKKQSLIPQVSKNDGPCFICGQQGDVGTCHNKICTKFYHLHCVNLEFWPEGKWVCPWHNCSICSKRTIRCCVKCINSYCPVHSEGNVRYDKLLGFICSEHDPTKESPEITNQSLTTVKNSKTSGVSTTEETDVTSTTPDEIDSNLSNQINKNIDDDISTIENQEIMLGESVTSTPIKNKELAPLVVLPEDYENSMVVDRADVSNTDIPDVQPEEAKSQLPAPGKRKRGRPKRSAGNSPKKIKLSSQVSSEAVVRLKRNFTTSNILDIPAQNEVKLSSSVPTRHLRTTRSGVASTELKRFLHRQSELEKDLPIRKRSRPRCEATL